MSYMPRAGCGLPCDPRVKIRAHSAVAGGKMRHLCASVAVVVLVLGVLSPPLSRGQIPASTSNGAQLYMGVGTCAAVQCHGSLRELTTSKAGVRQTEHPHWLFKEKHA